jgi:hypothetical protein
MHQKQQAEMENLHPGKAGTLEVQSWRNLTGVRAKLVLQRRECEAFLALEDSGGEWKDCRVVFSG